MAKIPFPKWPSEFNIQAILFSRIDSLVREKYSGFSVHGEVTGPKLSFRRGCPRFDLVVYRGEEAIAIIEVKNKKPKSFNTKTRQYKTYSHFGIELIYCFAENEINDCVCSVESVIKKNTK